MKVNFYDAVDDALLKFAVSDDGIAMTQLMRGKGGDTDLLQFFHHGIPAITKSSLGYRLPILEYDVT